MFKFASYLPCRNPKNTNVVEGMVKALARVVSSVQVKECFQFILYSFILALLFISVYVLEKVDIIFIVLIIARLPSGHSSLNRFVKKLYQDILF